LKELQKGVDKLVKRYHRAMQPDLFTMQIETEANSLSFGELVCQYQHKVFHTCFVLLHNREDAEDVAQEVFLEIHRSIDKFRGESSLSTWIHRIAVNRSMDFLRMKSRKKRNLFAFIPKGSDEMAQLQVSSGHHPLALLEEKERNAMLNAAIDQLPERQRIAFSLAKIEGLKQDQVAQILLTTVASVESLLVRAKQNLREVLLRELNR
jgi:RNA polymerase sigma factor (sigma-70 family)